MSPAAASSTFTDKVALLIGNQTYENLDDLTTPECDVRRVAKYLKKEFDFRVIVLVDLGFFYMVDAFEKFYLLAQAGTFAVVFFGGHGFEASGDQYMIPVDSTNSKTTRTEIGVQSVLRVLESASVRCSFTILDCCRNPCVCLLSLDLITIDMCFRRLPVPAVFGTPQDSSNSCISIVLNAW